MRSSVLADGRKEKRGGGAVTVRDVLFVTSSEAFGGTERHLLEVLKRLDPSSVRASILETNVSMYGDLLVTGNIRCDVVHSGWIDGTPIAWFRLFRRSRPDIVVYVNNWYRSFPWFVSAIGWLSGARRQYAIHHLLAPEMEKIEGFGLGQLVRRVVGMRMRRLWAFAVSTAFLDTIICVSDAIRRRLITEYRFPADKTITIHNGVSTSEYIPSVAVRREMRTKLQIPANTFTLVCVARLIEQKGIDILLRAMSAVALAGIDCTCIIVGDGPLRSRLLLQAEELGISRIVRFEGHQENVLPYLQASDAFVLASVNEGLPLSILEAMASGLPCIVTDVGGNTEIVIHEKNGWVASVGSSRELADGIMYMASRPECRAAMSELARKRICEDFKIDNCVESIKQIIGCQ